MADYVVLTLDVNDVDLQTEFWCAALGLSVGRESGPYRALVDDTKKLPTLLLQQVSEPHTGKNRLHIDVHVPDVDAEAARLAALGAAHVGVFDELGTRWIWMTDPEGNEFCVCPTKGTATGE
jgi:predicted enzyme related to lactoylglutathione lyase